MSVNEVAVPMAKETGQHELETLKDDSVLLFNRKHQSATFVRTKNRRMRWLEKNPDYFSGDLELVDPLLYDRLVRRFQSATEREAEGRRKGYSGVLESDILRSEAKLDALKHADPNVAITYKRSLDGQIVAEDKDEAPQSKEEGLEMWRKQMEWRFLKGGDTDFDYSNVDDNEAYDDRAAEERDEEEKVGLSDIGCETNTDVASIVL